ncbi:MAG: Rieske 2Fe-2S domain-containing protein [Acidobacteriia bacterium]|jgi:cytochrome b6-f complex iron-sulfur subunit|nr:Rieske 2Fe-2S domain-containing protein [Terriglobia bacterium]
MSSSEGSRREKRSSSDQSAKVTSEEKIKGGTISKVLKFFGKGGLVSPIVRRRRMVTALVLGFLGTNFFMFLRFFFPRTLFEPKTVFRIGYPSDFGYGIDTKFQKDHRIWVVRNSEGIFVIYATCTHLGCTPDWKPSENKFKCPCHGSGYDTEGVNFEGPAPRPLDRAKVELDAEGQIVVDTGVLFTWPKGMRSEFQDPGAFLRL